MVTIRSVSMQFLGTKLIHGETIQFAECGAYVNVPQLTENSLIDFRQKFMVG